MRTPETKATRTSITDTKKRMQAELGGPPFQVCARNHDVAAPTHARVDPPWPNAPTTAPGAAGRRLHRGRHIASLALLWSGLAVCVTAAWLGLRGAGIVASFWPWLLALAFGLFAWAWILEALAYPQQKP